MRCASRFVGYLARYLATGERKINWDRTQDHRTAIRMGPRFHLRLRLVEPRFQRDAITIAVDARSDLLPVWGSDDQVQQVFLNVLVNAWQAMPEGGCITIQGRELDNGRVSAAIGDAGCGIAPDVIARIFAPFFTTKEAGNGTGLGLAIAKQIIDHHGGTIYVESTPEVETIVTITLWPAEASQPGRHA